MMLRFIFGLMALLTLYGCPAHLPTTPSMPQGIPLQEICERHNVVWNWDGVTQVVLLEYKGNKAKALVGSNVVLVGKEKLILSAPLRRINSTIYVPEDFESKVISPYGVPSVSPDLTGFKIRSVVIDAGHGGKDPGAQGRAGTREKDIVLDIAKRVKTLLEESGLKVIMTRTTDEFISLNERTEIASKSDAGLFVSIHANSNPSKKTEGMEVYYVQTKTKKDLDEEQRQKNEKMFAKTLNMKFSPQMTGIVGDMMYSHKTAESAKLAQKMVNEGSKHVQTPNRGARSCRFFVVRNTLMPAVLIEIGFVSSRTEERKLSTPAYRRKLAETIAKSILDYAADS